LSTVRYQSGEKPAWILEIEEARATSTGAIGQSEAWAGNARQQDEREDAQEVRQKEKQEEEETAKRNADETDRNITEQAKSNDIDTTPIEPVTPSERAVANELTALTSAPSSDQPVTSSQAPVNDAIDDLTAFDSHIASDESSQRDSELKIVSDEPHDQTPFAIIQPTISDENQAAISDSEQHDLEHQMMAAKAGDDDVSKPVLQNAIEQDFEVCEKTADLSINQQSGTDGFACEVQHSRQQQQQQQQSVSTAEPRCMSSSSSDPVAAAETVARQQTPPPGNSVSSSGEAGRVKRRHKDDKSKTNEQSTDVCFCRNTVHTGLWPSSTTITRAKYS